MNYSKFHGKHITSLCDCHAKSSYCRNYYMDDEGNEILVLSDDDNHSVYMHNNIEFAESFTSNNDIIEVYDEFMMYNPCLDCKHQESECKSCYYGKLQTLYVLATVELKKHAQCETCAHADCRNKELYGALGQNCLNWRYKEEPNQ